MTPHTESLQQEPSGVFIAAVIARRELIRFSRQPARIIAAIGTPVLLWLLMASGFAQSIAPAALDHVSYTAFLLPGILTLVAVFAAIFASISVIDDRQQGWLQSALASPAPRWSIAAGKIAGSSIVAWVQACLLLPSLLLLDLPLTVVGVVLAIIGLAVVSVSMASLGLAFAWRCESTSSFHAVMNLVFMPMWLLSGAFFPPDGAAAWMQPLVMANPLTWATHAIRAPLLGEPAMVALAVSCVFATVMFAVATTIVSTPRR